MFEIVRREELAPSVFLFEVVAPRVAHRHRAGQFVMVRPTDRSERIPLTVADTNVERGTITLVVQAVGKTTMEMAEVGQEGSCFSNVAGPLGNPTHLGLPGKPEGYRGTVACVAGGIGAAPILPIVKAFSRAGHEVITILGARRKDLLILRENLEASSERVLVCTDDGSEGRKGFVTDVLKDLIVEQRAHGEDVHLAIAIGPPLMMKFCAATTRPFGVPTLVSLNTIMVDGTGMCGGCRVAVGTETKYVCVDGPEFDGHLVDFDLMMRRQAMYKAEEAEALARWQRCEGCHAQAAADALPREAPAAPSEA